MERVAPPGKAEGGIPGDRKFGVRVSFFNGSNFVNSVYESFDPDCGSDWQYVSAAAVALVTYSCKILNVGGSMASALECTGDGSVCSIWYPVPYSGESRPAR